MFSSFDVFDIAFKKKNMEYNPVLFAINHADYDVVNRFFILGYVENV